MQTVSNYIPKQPALPKALTAQKLLKKYGYPCLIKIGVGKDIKGKFEAHAWLEYAEKVVIGESVKEYVPLTDL